MVLGASLISIKIAVPAAILGYCLHKKAKNKRTERNPVYNILVKVATSNESKTTLANDPIQRLANYPA